MDIEILEFQLRPSRIKIAAMKVRYNELIIKCDLAYYAKEHKAWVRMPEIWLTPKNKTTFCYWPTKEVSDRFQEIVLKKIFDNYDLDLNKVGELHKSIIKKK